MASKIGTPCPYCGAMDVYYHYAPNGGVYYRCESCYEKWE